MGIRGHALVGWAVISTVLVEAVTLYLRFRGDNTLATPALAAVDLVTIPTREGTQLTIYNSEDITMVRVKPSGS